MWVLRALSKASVTFALMSSAFFATSAAGQSPVIRPHSTGATSKPEPGSTEDRVPAHDSKPKDYQSEIDAVKAENVALRELLRKIEEQQRILLEQVTRLQRRLDGGVATDLSIVGQPNERPTTADVAVLTTDTALNTPHAVTESASSSLQPAPVAATPNNSERYRDGIVIWQTREDARVPFLLNFNINTQLRYLNTLSSDAEFTDHLGVVREVHRRNDITVNRAMFILGGYIFDTRLRYSFTVWTSAGAASIVVAGEHLPIFCGDRQEYGGQLLPSRLHPGRLGDRRTREGAELSGVRRQRSQYLEYLGSEDRYESAGFRQRLVGTAGAVRGTGQITEYVR